MNTSATKLLFAGKEYNIQLSISDPDNLIIQICDKTLDCSIEEIKIKSSVFFELLISTLY
jgi:hypothetical protein